MNYKIETQEEIENLIIGRIIKEISSFGFVVSFYVNESGVGGGNKKCQIIIEQDWMIVIDITLGKKEVEIDIPIACFAIIDNAIISIFEDCKKYYK